MFIIINEHMCIIRIFIKFMNQLLQINFQQVI